MNLDEIKQYLTEKNYDAVLITRNNHFLGQDVLETENRILALTGFSGSAGTLVVTKEKSIPFYRRTLRNTGCPPDRPENNRSALRQKRNADQLAAGKIPRQSQNGI